jgi:hypothetical protein
LAFLIAYWTTKKVLIIVWGQVKRKNAGKGQIDTFLKNLKSWQTAHQF